jgi:hypothetical protein
VVQTNIGFVADSKCKREAKAVELKFHCILGEGDSVGSGLTSLFVGGSPIDRYIGVGMK